MFNDDVLYLTVRALAEQIKAGKLSPVALTEAYLKRSEKIGGRLNAYANLTPERALEEAREAEREIKGGKYRGPLHGIPYAAKDLLAAKGYPTTWGARPYAKQKFDNDATVVAKLKDAGAILIGKAAMIELAGSFGYRYGAASLSGPGLNPWNDKHWAGGSSSGSGIIAAAGLAPFAIGTETWGSILCPSSFCGVSGLRPTYGRVSRHGGMTVSASMDKIGVIARSIDDCGLVFQYIAGHDPLDASSREDAAYADNPQPLAKPLRVGWCVNAYKKMAPDVAATLDKARKSLTGPEFAVSDAKLPEGGPWDEAAGTVLSVEAAAAFDELLKSGRVAELDDPLQRIGGYVARVIPTSDYLRAQRIRAVMQRLIDKMFDQYDVLAAASFPIPSSPITANLEGEEFDFPDPLGAFGNFCGLPAVSVPCGFSKENLPLAVQLVGRAMNDATVVSAGRLFQQKTDWHTKRPPVKS
jgi:aspartyl-tRNA(Asn)/glutamyl-tRNA(Gln) amidotransferase subunit A